MIHPADYDLAADDFDITQHVHTTGSGEQHNNKVTVHTHAYGTMDHGHMMQAICNAEECKGLKDTHNIHPALKRTTEQVRENPLSDEA
jgi:hypothetical protein